MRAQSRGAERAGKGTTLIEGKFYPLKTTNTQLSKSRTQIS